MKAKSKVLMGCILISISLLACGLDPPGSFIQTPEPGWKIIEIRDGLVYDQMWQITVDTLSSKYDIEVMDKDGGYIRTGYIYTYMLKEGKITDRYRSRITIKFDKGDKGVKICKVRAEANFLTGDGWVQGYDSILLDNVYNDLQGKLGRVVR